jgi:hypothetical protein
VSSISSPSLAEMLAYARAGAAEQAWRMFREAGLEAVVDDPAVLAARGRLLKARGAAAGDPRARRRLYAEAADAYAAAGAARGETYLLINAATLSLLGGDREGARGRAEAVLAALAARPDEPETPYWLAATRAEALLVLGRVAAAREALGEAMRVAPKAWEDHAPTLRQFGLILAALGEDDGWLERFRPPRTLHFAGRIALGGKARALAEEAGEAMAAAGVGFGYGALAAGADIVIAEQLAARGGELNIVLPAEPDAFRAASVTPAGGDWDDRFDALLAAAESLRVVSSAAPASHPLSIRLAAEVAMGQALLRAEALATTAVQIVVADDPARGGETSAWILKRWRRTGQAQHAVAIGTGAPAAARDGAGRGPRARLAAFLAVEVAEPDAARLAGPVLTQIRAALAKGPAPALAPSWLGRTLGLVFDDPASAAGAALRLRDSGAPVRIGGAYGVVLAGRAAAGAEPLLVGEAAELAAHAMASAPLGAAHVSDDFAAALQTFPSAPRLEPVGALSGGEPGRETGLYALTR